MLYKQTMNEIDVPAGQFSRHMLMQFFFASLPPQKRGKGGSVCRVNSSIVNSQSS